MPLFRRKEKSKPSISSPAFRSVEHLPPHPPSSSSSAAPPFDSDDSSSSTQHHQHHRFPVSTSQQFPPHPQPQSQSHHPHTYSESQSQPQPQSQSQSQPVYSWDARQPPPPRNPARSGLQRSHTQRLRTPPDVSTLSNSNSTVTVVTNNPSPSSYLEPPRSFDADVSDQSVPSSPTDKPDDQEPRRSKRSLFSFHSSNSSTSLRDQPSLLERNRSVKVSSRRPQQQQQQQTHRQQQSPQLTQHSRSSLDWSREYAVDAAEAEYRPPSMPQQSSARGPDPGFAPHTRSPPPRSNTDPRLADELYRQSPVENSRHGAELIPATNQLDHRPPSQHSLGPPSPYLFPKSDTSSVTQLPAMSDRPSGSHSQNQSQQQSASQSNAGQQQASLDQGRATPAAKDNRTRDDLSEADVRTILQKYDELQAKYSKVKRYYFERDAQVQQLQNTVAHQRMAVSRTVLDDNEYSNRFGRLDGAIKDLAFSIRKDWKTLPTWLSGFVNEDAPATGTKEMTAIGRSVMSHWLVDEVFERYFHPALEPAFSQQLKAIEMTLRRQHTNIATDEDKENSIARISNWRRTTLDGLGDSLQGPAADEYRAELINRLVDNLVATLVSYLHDPAPPGIDNGARMIVENAVGIAEKIPLESRDICVEYIPPGSPIHDATMKIEPGVLPPLTHAASPSDSRPSTDLPSNHHSNENGTAADNDRDTPLPSASPNAHDNVPAREQRMRSVFSNIMGRKPGQAPPASPGPGSTPTPAGNDVRRGSGTPATVPGSAPGVAGPGSGTGRIRLAAFVTAEVRGRGPMNVLVKAPAYPMEY
ncbi:uncharacterized protein DSM5745_09523 [Aspergillus mulundensis]|uniref:Uncharacterized protein n=1 Tax=Aspergillus mulundensis TaxID=1810919 RepID=A0A3D8QW87_9EURO|nr:Uncharacterized protein DSM5745_09523 [Aspergillus mulundensis]RDW65784.1 Uncharacterized protein DSM5745_09523 [Aspergillus mulundensis]